MIAYIVALSFWNFALQINNNKRPNQSKITAESAISNKSYATKFSSLDQLR